MPIKSNGNGSYKIKTGATETYGELDTASSKLIKNANAQFTQQAQSSYNPLYTPSNLVMPTRNREISQWARKFYRTEPLVYTGTNLNAEFPVTDFINICKDPKIQQYYDDMAEKMDLQSLLMNISMEHNKIGNVFPQGIWDDSEGNWKRFVILNPDYVEVESTPYAPNPVMYLDPDDGLKRVIKDKKPLEIYDQIDPVIKQYVMQGKKVPLSNIVISMQKGKDASSNIEFNQVSHLANKNSPYEAYGTTPLYAAFQALFYKDLIRQTQLSVVRRHWKPVKVVKVGDETHHADDGTLNNVREALSQVEQDNAGWFIWHNYINFEYVSSNGHVMPMDRELDWVDREIYGALGINKSMIMGESVNYASANVGLQILLNRYLKFQKMLARWVKKFIYEPVARVNEFYETDRITGKQKLIVPDISFEMMRMRDDVQQKQLLDKLQKSGLISKRTLLTRSLPDLDYEYEKEQLRREKDEEIKAKMIDDAKGKPPAASESESGGGMDEGITGGEGEELGGGGDAPEITQMSESPEAPPVEEGAGGEASELGAIENAPA